MTLKQRLDAIDSLTLAEVGSHGLLNSCYFDRDDELAFALGCVEMANLGWPLSEPDLSARFRAAYILKLEGEVLDKKRSSWTEFDIPLFGESYIRR